jgi:hypothetical protein
MCLLSASRQIPIYPCRHSLGPLAVPAALGEMLLKLLQLPKQVWICCLAMVYKPVGLLAS